MDMFGCWMGSCVHELEKERRKFGDGGETFSNGFFIARKRASVKYNKIIINQHIVDDPSTSER